MFRRTTSIVGHPRLVELFLWLVLVLQAELTSGGMPAAQPSDLLIRQGIEAVEKGAYQQAIRILTQAVGRSTVSPVAVFYLAEAYIHLDQPGNAIPHYQRLIQSQPDAVQAHYGLAAAYRELEEYPLAVESYQQAIDLSLEARPPSELPILKKRYNPADILQDLGVAFSELKQYQSAIQSFQRAIRLDSGNPTPYYNLGLVYFKQGKLESAIISFQQAVDLEPNYADAYNGLGETYLKQSKLKLATQAFQRSANIDPDQLSPHYGLGQIYSKQGKHQQAVEAYQQVIQIQPDYSDAHYNLARTYLKLGLREKATEIMSYFEDLRRTDPLLRQAQLWVKQYPDDPRGYHNLGLVYEARRLYDQAIEFYQHALILSPDLAATCYNLGLVYSRLDRLREAIEAYRRAIQLDGQLAIGHNNLALLLIVTEPDQALKHAQQAVRLQPENANYLDTLGEIYYHLKRYREAKQAIDQAMALDPEQTIYQKRQDKIQQAIAQSQK